MSDSSFEKPAPIVLDEDVAARMRNAGIERPEEVSSSYNYGPVKTEEPRIQTIIYLSTKGLNTTEIAQSIGMAPASVGRILKDERVVFEIKQLNYKLHGVDAQKRFKEILPFAIDALQDVIMDIDAKPAVKANAATYMIDRVLGRPKQSLEVEGSLIREMLEKLSQSKTVSASQVSAGQTKDAEVVSVPKDPIDLWAQQNLK